MNYTQYDRFSSSSYVPVPSSTSLKSAQCWCYALYFVYCVLFVNWLLSGQCFVHVYWGWCYSNDFSIFGLPYRSMSESFHYTSKFKFSAVNFFDASDNNGVFQRFTREFHSLLSRYNARAKLCDWNVFLVKISRIITGQYIIIQWIIKTNNSIHVKYTALQIFNKR